MVQSSLSSQVLPVSGVVMQPVAELQPGALHWSPPVHTRAVPPAHCPLALQVSPSLHSSLSSHGDPVLGVSVQPVDGLQPAVLH